jgi:hypothetical protein
MNLMFMKFLMSNKSKKRFSIFQILGVSVRNEMIGGSEWRSGSVWAQNLSVRNEMFFRLCRKETGKRGT